MFSICPAYAHIRCAGFCSCCPGNANPWLCWPVGLCSQVQQEYSKLNWLSPQGSAQRQQSKMANSQVFQVTSLFAYLKRCTLKVRFQISHTSRSHLLVGTTFGLSLYLALDCWYLPRRRFAHAWCPSFYSCHLWDTPLDFLALAARRTYIHQYHRIVTKNQFFIGYSPRAQHRRNREIPISQSLPKRGLVANLKRCCLRAWLPDSLHPGAD